MGRCGFSFGQKICHFIAMDANMSLTHLICSLLQARRDLKCYSVFAKNVSFFADNVFVFASRPGAKEVSAF
jgi:hypothetical protein